MPRIKILPAGHNAWEQPGYTYSIGWPPGYAGTPPPEPALTTIQKRRRAGEKAGPVVALAQVTPAMRAGGLAAPSNNRGHLGSFKPKTDEQRAKEDKLRRGRSL